MPKASRTRARARTKIMITAMMDAKRGETTDWDSTSSPTTNNRLRRRGGEGALGFIKIKRGEEMRLAVDYDYLIQL